MGPRGRKPRSKFKEHFLNVGAVIVGIAILVTLVLFVVAQVREKRFQEEFQATVETALGPGPVSVAAVVSARTAARAFAEERGDLHGPAHGRLTTRLVQRDLPDGVVSHFLVLDAHAGGHHAEYERDLGQLEAAAIDSFAKANIREYHVHR